MKLWLLTIGWLFGPSLGRYTERAFLNMKEIQDMVQREVESIAIHSEFFLASNVFFNICENRLKPVLASLYLEEEQNLYFCKLIENAIPEYFLPVLMVAPGKNQKLLETVIKDFFKIFTEEEFDVDQIRVPKIFHENVSVLYKLRGLFEFDEGYFEVLLGEYLPLDSREATHVKLSKVCSTFMDFFAFRIVEVLKPYMYENDRLFLFTMYQMFESPFDILSLLFNDLEYLKQSFSIRFRSRILFLMDSLDTYALKALNVFKANRTEAFIAEASRDAQKHLREDANQGPSDSNLEIRFGGGEAPPLDYVSEVEGLEQPVVEQLRPTNFRLLNSCVRNSAFASQSLEKLYCYELTTNIREDLYLYENPRWAERLGQVFAENSRLFFPDFVGLQASYFVEESQFSETMLPRFRQNITEATVAFKRSLNDLRRQFVDANFAQIRQNFEYVFRQILVKFLSDTVFLPNSKADSLYTNILNFFEFVDDLWTNRQKTEYLKLTELEATFVSKFNINLETFNRFK